MTADVFIARVQAAAKAGQVRTLEDALPLIPEDMRRRVMFVKTSGSLQPGSLQQPRVILSNVGEFTLAYSGAEDPTPTTSPSVFTDQDGNDPLKDHATTRQFEMLQFREDGARFEAYTLTFPPGGGMPVAEKDPKVCASCHGRDTHPIHDSYRRWRNIIGEHSDRPTTEELVAIRGILDAQATNPRYGLLIDVGTQYAPTGPAKALQAQPGFLFGAHFNTLNFQRVARIIEATPNYAAHKSAIIGTLLCEKSSVRESARPFLPTSLAQQYDRSATSRIFDAKVDPYGAAAAFAAPGSGSNGSALGAKLDYLFNSRGIATDEWYLSSIPHDHNMNDGVLGDGSHVTDSDSLAERLATSDDEKKLVETPRAERDEGCAKLAQKSRAALNRGPAGSYSPSAHARSAAAAASRSETLLSTPSDSWQSMSAVFQRGCAGCHGFANSRDGVSDRGKSILERLDLRSSESMPPPTSSVRITGEERARMIDWLSRGAPQ